MQNKFYIKNIYIYIFLFGQSARLINIFCRLCALESIHNVTPLLQCNVAILLNVGEAEETNPISFSMQINVRQKNNRSVFLPASQPAKQITLSLMISSIFLTNAFFVCHEYKKYNMIKMNNL